MSRQKLVTLSVWAESHGIFRELSFTERKPITVLADEAVKLLAEKYANEQPADKAPKALTAA